MKKIMPPPTDPLSPLSLSCFRPIPLPTPCFTVILCVLLYVLYICIIVFYLKIGPKNGKIHFRDTELREERNSLEILRPLNSLEIPLKFC